MVEFRALENLDLADLIRVASGYSSASKYEVEYNDAPGSVTFELRLVELEQPNVKEYDHLDAATAERYQSFLPQGYSFGAYDDGVLIGIAIAEEQSWNQTLWMHEFHIAESHRGQGVGRQLMEHGAERAATSGLRTIVCETQNTNAGAIDFYGRIGFRIEGIDLSLYKNTDYPDGEIALFLKRRLL